MRRSIAVAVVVLHGLLLWLLVVGLRPRIAKEPVLEQFVSLWVDPPAPVDRMPPPEPPRPVSIRQQRRSEPSAAPITPPIAPAPDATAVAPVTPAPPVDWRNEASLAARRAAEAAANPPSETFSPAPKALPKPCVPRKSSMQWNGKEDRRIDMSGGVPVVRLNDRCVLVLGVIPACVIGKLPETNGHLLDDMKDPNRSPSSVPDPNVCD